MNNDYDHGPIIIQRAAPVLETDTLAARVFEAGCQAYPDASRLLAEGRLEIENRWLRIC